MYNGVFTMVLQILYWFGGPGQEVFGNGLYGRLCMAVW